MFGRDKGKAHTRQQFFTDTYLSSLSAQEKAQGMDINVYKAIKQNNVEHLVQKDRQNAVQIGQIYNEEKELLSIIVEIRKKYDNEKIKTAKTEKNIHNMQEQRNLLKSQVDKLQNEIVSSKTNHQILQGKHQKFEESLQYLEYMRDIRYDMEERLKHDILHYKKQCFQDNIVLVRLKTCIRQLQQKDITKKNLHSKSKLVLNTLQQTVKIRQNQRQHHIKQVETILMRKLQNTELKTNRQQELESSMYKALTERLPEQNLLINKFYCQLFLRKMLRRKMNQLMDRFKAAQDAFSVIRKQTKISSAAQFIQDYLTKEKRYGHLLNQIGKAQKKIADQKQKYQELQKQNSILQYQSSEIDEFFEKMNHKHKDSNQQYKKLILYNDLTIKCQELKLMLNRWAYRSYHSLQQNDAEGKAVLSVNAVNDLPLLKQLVNKSLKTMIQSSNQKPPANQPVPTERTENQQSNRGSKINLNTLTSESALSKQCSKKNFRVRTMTTHEQAINQQDIEYDDLSQYDFLKYNRRMAKKNNTKTQRLRIKTKPF